MNRSDDGLTIDATSGVAAIKDEPVIYENAYLLDGPDILKNIGGLSPGRLHPGDQRMIFLGENLARHIKPLTEPLYQ